jgi:hypothetical protein
MREKTENREIRENLENTVTGKRKTEALAVENFGKSGTIKQYFRDVDTEAPEKQQERETYCTPKEREETKNKMVDSSSVLFIVDSTSQTTSS